MSPQAVVKLVEELKCKYTVHLICFALMYPYLLTTDGKRKTFLQPLSRKLLVKFVRKTKFIYGYRKIKYLIQKELNQIVNHKVVQRIMQKKWLELCRETEKKLSK